MKADSYEESVHHDAEMFTYERCEFCGGGLHWHTISVGPFGHPHIWCIVEEATPTDDDDDYIARVQGMAVDFANGKLSGCGHPLEMRSIVPDKPGELDATPQALCRVGCDVRS